MKDESLSLREKILLFLERDRLSFTAAVVYIFILGAVRSVMEAYVGNYYGYSIYLFFQHVILSYPEILIGVLLVYIITRIDIKKIWNVFIFGFWILLLPPIIDFIVFGDYGTELGAQYEYQEPGNLLPILKNIWNPMTAMEVGSRGQGVMFILLLVGATAYVALKTDLTGKIIKLVKLHEISSFVKALSKTIGTYFIIAILVFFIGGFTLIMRLEGEYVILLNFFRIDFQVQYYLFFQNHGFTYDQVIAPPNSGYVGLAQNLINQQYHLLMSCFFILLTIFAGLSILYIKAEKKLIIMLKNIPWGFSSLVLSLSILGVASVHMLDPDFSKNWALDPTYILHLPYIFLGLTTLFFLTMFSKFMLDLGKNNIDESNDDPLRKGLISKYHYVHLCSSLALTALFFSFVLGLIVFILSVLWIALTIILIKIKLTLLKRYGRGFFGILAFLFGFYTPGSWISFYMRPVNDSFRSTRVSVPRIPYITPEIIFIIIWIFLSLWFISLAKMILKKEGVYQEIKTISYAKLEIIIMIISVFLLLFPLVFFNSWSSMLLFSSIALITPLWYRFFKRIEVVNIILVIDVILFASYFIG